MPNLDRIIKAARIDQKVIRNFGDKNSIHSLYGYPARFSPYFAGECIAELTSENDFVLDPFCGSGTTLIEALRRKRRVIGIDVSEISSFITERLLRAARYTTLNRLVESAQEICDRLESPAESSGYLVGVWPEEHFDDQDFREIFATLESFVYESHSYKGEVGKLLRMVALSAGQAAIDGKRKPDSRVSLIGRLRSTAIDFAKILDFWNQSLNEIWGSSSEWVEAVQLVRGDSVSEIDTNITSKGLGVDAVVTSPPYPGVHILYGKWQVRGRRETHLPAHILGIDPRPERFYTMGTRYDSDAKYFEQNEEMSRGLWSALSTGKHMVQLVGFKDPQIQLPRFVDAYTRAGFELLTDTSNLQNMELWRDVPSRKWHANSRVGLTTSKEAVLVFRKPSS